MRLISQDGTSDVPYERYSVCVIKDEYRNIYHIVCDYSEASYRRLAEYSTEAKAKKAMEMLRDAYTSSCYSDNGYDYSAQINRPYLFMENRVFHFPQDSEIAD